MRSGLSPPLIRAAMALAAATPASRPPRSPVEYTFLAPNLPSDSANAAPSPATNADTLSVRLRALVSSSAVKLETVALLPWAKTQTLLIVMMMSP